MFKFLNIILIITLCFSIFTLNAALKKEWIKNYELKEQLSFWVSTAVEEQVYKNMCLDVIEEYINGGNNEKTIL